MDIIFSLIILIMSVVLHEVSHGYTAAILGDPTAKYAGRLTLNPLKHLDPMGSFVVPLITSALGGPTFGWAKPVPYNPYNLRGGKWGPAIVAVAGPLSNLLLAVFFSLVLHAAIFQSFLSAGLIRLIAGAIRINIILFVVNIIPIPPIDGSKILFSLIPYRYNYIVEFMERYQLILMLVIIFFLDAIVLIPFNILYSILVG